MAELDPYVTLGVTRAATHDEVARAYRRLAKRWHPDAAAGAREQASRAASMARINQAWHILSNRARRARWDAAHPVPGAAAHWGTARAPVGPASRRTAMAGASAADATAKWAPPVARRAPATPEAPGSLRESGWLAIAVAGVLLAAFVAAIAIVGQAQSDASAPWDGAETFRSDHLSFLHDPGWAAYPGRDDPAAAHGVVAHVVTYPIDAMTACTVLSGACARIGETVPPGEFSVVITYHQAGSPPVAEPVYSRPYGLDADAFVGGEPAVFEWRSLEDRAQAWWQLSPPGFPARWFEVHADIGGGTVEQGNGLIALQSLLATLVFAE